MPSSMPTIGRIVHYTIAENEEPVNGSCTFPAIITFVHSEDLVNLQVFYDAYPNENHWKTSVNRNNAPNSSWDWPPLS